MIYNNFQELKEHFKEITYNTWNADNDKRYNRKGKQVRNTHGRQMHDRKGSIRFTNRRSR